MTLQAIYDYCENNAAGLGRGVRGEAEILQGHNLIHALAPDWKASVAIHFVEEVASYFDHNEFLAYLLLSLEDVHDHRTGDTDHPE